MKCNPVGKVLSEGLTDFIMNAACDKIRETAWYRTCPDESLITMSLKGIETQIYGTIYGDRFEVPGVVVVANGGAEGGLREVFLRLDRL